MNLLSVFISSILIFTTQVLSNYFERDSKCQHRVLRTNNGKPPAGLMSIADIKRLWTLPSDHPEVRRLSEGKNMIIKNYSPRAIEHLEMYWDDRVNEPSIRYISDYEGKTERCHKAITQDGEQAYLYALLFQVDCNKYHAEKVLEIANAWATKNKKANGKNAALEYSWATASMTRALALMKATYMNFNETVEINYKNWMESLVIPIMYRDVMNGYDSFKFNQTNSISNWEASLVDAMFTYDVFAEKPDAISKVVRRLDRGFYGVKGFSNKQNREMTDQWFYPPTGQNLEICRDSYHSQFAIMSVTNVLEALYHQGMDQWNINDGLIWKALEFEAYLKVKGEYPPGAEIADMDIPDREGNRCTGKNPIRHSFFPGWQVSYRHWSSRMNKTPHLPMFNEVLQGNNRDVYSFHWGANALTHG